MTPMRSGLHRDVWSHMNGTTNRMAQKRWLTKLPICERQITGEALRENRKMIRVTPTLAAGSKARLKTGGVGAFCPDPDSSTDRVATLDVSLAYRDGIHRPSTLCPGWESNPHEQRVLKGV